jgi:sentrin-specific protease 1
MILVAKDTDKRNAAAELVQPSISDALKSLPFTTALKLSANVAEAGRQFVHYSGDEGSIIQSGFNVHLMLKDVRTLKPATCLNDEIINFWLNLLQERDCNAGRNNRYFNSFFLSKLLRNGYDYNAMLRWTRKMNIFEDFEKLIFAYNDGDVHWELLTATMVKPKSVHFLDSMGGT